MQWTPVPDPPSQLMCAGVLAGFLRFQFHDYLANVLDKYVRAVVSFANLGVREEARALMEQQDFVTRSGWRVQWQKAYMKPWTPCMSRGKGGSAHWTSSGPPALQPARGGGSIAPVPSAATAHTTDSAEGVEQKHNKRPRSEARDRSRSPSRQRRHWLHGGSRRSRSRSSLPRRARRVDSYYTDQYMHNPMSLLRPPPFQYAAAYGYIRAHSGTTTPTHTYQALPRPFGHSLLPSPGNGQTNTVATYPSPATTPQT